MTYGMYFSTSINMHEEVLVLLLTLQQQVPLILSMEGSSELKAAVLHEKNDIRFEEIEEQKVHLDEVKIKVHVAGICGSETHKMATKWKYPLPAVMGHELAGEVVEVGSNVTNIAVGERLAVTPLLPCNECVYCKKG